MEVALFKAGSVDSRVVSVDDLDAEDDLLKSTGCVCCCTGIPQGSTLDEAAASKIKISMNKWYNISAKN